MDTKAQLNYVGSHFSSLEIWALQSANFIARRCLRGNPIQTTTVHIDFKEPQLAFCSLLLTLLWVDLNRCYIIKGFFGYVSLGNIKVSNTKQVS